MGAQRFQEGRAKHQREDRAAEEQATFESLIQQEISHLFAAPEVDHAQNFLIAVALRLDGDML